MALLALPADEPDPKKTLDQSLRLTKDPDPRLDSGKRSDPRKEPDPNTAPDPMRFVPRLLKMNLARDIAEAEDFSIRGNIKQINFINSGGKVRNKDAHLWHCICGEALDDKRRQKCRREIRPIDDAGSDDRPTRMQRLPDGCDPELAQTCLGQLTNSEQLLIRLHAIEARSFPEIGELLGIPKSTCHARYSQALARLTSLYFRKTG